MIVERIENETDCNMPQGSCWSTVFSGFYLFLARHSGNHIHFFDKHAAASEINYIDNERLVRVFDNLIC